MKDILQLGPSFDSLNKGVKGKNKTPRDIGIILFKNLLQKTSRSFQEQERRLLLFETQESKHGIFQENVNKELNLLPKLNKKIRELGVPISHLVIPEAALPQLVFFLEIQGLSKAKIDQLILSARDKDGSLKIDQFLPYLISSDQNRTLGADNHGLVIQSRDIPRLEEVLFHMGLGAGDIKEIVEKSKTSNGDIDLTRLSAVLSKFHSTTSEKELLSLLEQGDIKSKPIVIDNKGIDQDLKRAFTDYSNASSQDIQKNIKQKITALLIEKGIPPQDVKSFVEKLNIQFAKSALKMTTAQDTEPHAILNQVTLSKQSIWRKGKWDEKILKILQSDRVLITKDIKPEKFDDQGEFRLNLSELLKQEDKKSKVDLFQEVALREKVSSSEDKGRPTYPVHYSRARSRVKEALGVEFVTARVDTETSRVLPFDPSKNTINHPHPLPKIIDRMIWMIRSGEQHGRIIINPPELGRLDLDLSIRHGHVHAQLSTENIVMKELIEANLVQLKQQLSDQGFIVDRLEVMVGLDDERSNGNNMWTGSERKRHPSSQSNDQEETDRHPTRGNDSMESMQSQLYKIDVHV